MVSKRHPRRTSESTAAADPCGERTARRTHPVPERLRPHHQPGRRTEAPQHGSRADEEPGIRLGGRVPEGGCLADQVGQTQARRAPRRRTSWSGCARSWSRSMERKRCIAEASAFTRRSISGSSKRRSARSRSTSTAPATRARHSSRSSHRPARSWRWWGAQFRQTAVQRRRPGQAPARFGVQAVRACLGAYEQHLLGADIHLRTGAASPSQRRDVEGDRVGGRRIDAAARRDGEVGQLGVRSAHPEGRTGQDRRDGTQAGCD